METSLPTGALYTVSMRGKHESVHVAEYLNNFFSHISLSAIDSVFGFVEKCSLYGGRPFTQPQLSDRDIEWLHENEVGLRLPLTNHFVERQEYESYRWLLEKYHHRLNSIIATNDELISWIREDFPLYKSEASVIKNINTPLKLSKALSNFDTVVLPMPCNDDVDFLQKIEQKDRIRLFANAGCAYTCPSRICYRSFSLMNKFGDARPECSFPIKTRDFQGMIDFELEPLIALGFKQFKVLRERPTSRTGF